MAPSGRRDRDYLLVPVPAQPHLDGAVQGGGENGLLDAAVQRSLGCERGAELVGDALAEGELVPGKGNRIAAEHGDRLDDAPLRPFRDRRKADGHPEVVHSPGPQDEDVGHRHAAHGRDADRPWGLLRHGCGTPEAESLRNEAGADERDGRRNGREPLPCHLSRRRVGHACYCGEKGTKASGDGASSEALIPFRSTSDCRLAACSRAGASLPTAPTAAS